MWRGIFLFVGSVFFSFQSQSFAKVETSLVFSGGGMQTPAFLGMLNGIEKQGIHPDLIIGTCGGSLAATIVKLFPNPKDRHDFIHSRKFHEMLLTAQLTGHSGLSELVSLAAKIKSGQRLPSFFTTYLMEVPENLGYPEGKNALFSSDGLKVLMIAAQVISDRFDDRDARFTETFFTDPHTAQELAGFQYKIPSNKVNLDTKTIVDASLIQAARASTTDPYFLNPVPVNGYYYLTGAIDLYPIEVAHLLSKHVIMSFSEGMNDIFERPVMQDVFGIDIKKRLKAVTWQSASYWVDYSGFGKMTEEVGFNPRGGKSLHQLVESGVPKDFDEFLRKVDAQLDWGFKRGSEAIEKGRGHPNFKGHVDMNRGNARKALRKRYDHRE